MTMGRVSLLGDKVAVVRPDNGTEESCVLRTSEIKATVRRQFTLGAKKAFHPPILTVLTPGGLQPITLLTQDSSLRRRDCSR